MSKYRQIIDYVQANAPYFFIMIALGPIFADQYLQNKDVINKGVIRLTFDYYLGLAKDKTGKLRGLFQHQDNSKNIGNNIETPVENTLSSSKNPAGLEELV